jgi:hypothetical protein
MAFETTLNLPTSHLSEFMTRLSKAGFLVLDTGERVATDCGPEAEATVRLLHVTVADVSEGEPCELGVSV